MVRIAKVFGTVTLSRCHPRLQGARWVLAQPMSLEALKTGFPDGEELVAYENLGAGLGDIIALSEGTEAAAPFAPNKVPVDAYSAIIIDYLEVE
jgi:ethanolamine utilization protein EutN